MDFSQLTNDPNKLGILSLGLRLMSTPGKLGSALGQAGMGAVGDMQAAQMQAERRKQAALQEQMTRLQLQDILDKQARAKAMTNAARAAFVPGTPGMMDTEAGGDGINMPAQAPRFDANQYMSSLAQNGAGDEAMQFFLSQQKQRKPLVLAEGGKAFDEETGAVIASNPKAVAPEKDPENIRVLKLIHGENTPAYFAALKQLGQKMTTHQPGTTVNIPPQIPAGAVKQQDEAIDRIATAKSIDADLGAIERTIQSGTLKFGPVRNLVNTGKNVAGMSDEESRAFATFKSTLEKLRNDSLRLNTGVQTEGDAQRAWNELFQNINDTAFVQKRLTEIRKINQRAAELHQYRLNVMRQNFNAPNLPLPEVPAALDAPKVRKYNPATGQIE